MGVLSEVVVADRAEAEDVAASGEPSRIWHGVAWKTVDPVKMGSLWIILEEIEATVDAVVARAGRLEPLAEGSESGPWVYLIPRALRDLLADLSGEEPEAMRRLAAAWGATEELREWEAAEVAECLQQFADLADSARLDEKDLLLWISV